MYDTILELLLQKYEKVTDNDENRRLSQKILRLLEDPKVNITIFLITSTFSPLFLLD